MTPEATLANTQFFRGSGKEANLACERKKISPHLRSGSQGSIYLASQKPLHSPRRNLEILNCRNVTYSFTDAPTVRDRDGHIQTQTCAHTYTHSHTHVCTHSYMAIKSQVCFRETDGKL